MKRRRDGGEPEHGRGFSPFKRRQKEQKKLGGGGLSLEAFVSAKSKPLINPAQIREHREFYQNAKKVQKYKKLVKQLGGQGRGASSNIEEAANDPINNLDSQVPNDYDRPKPGAPNHGKKKLRPFKKTDGKQFKIRRKNPQHDVSQLERLREEHEKEKLDEEEKRREREELHAEQQKAREKAQRERKEVQARLRKKTKRGQPVMKHRMEQLLETIQRGSK